MYKPSTSVILACFLCWSVAGCPQQEEPEPEGAEGADAAADSPLDAVDATPPLDTAPETPPDAGEPAEVADRPELPPQPSVCETDADCADGWYCPLVESRYAPPPGVCYERGAFRAACETDDDCIELCIDSGHGFRLCTLNCVAIGGQCPSEWRCIQAIRPGQDVVFVCGPNPPIGTVCEFDGDCGDSGHCLAFGESNTTVCTQACEVTAGCPAEWTCSPAPADTGIVGSICQPER